MWWDGSKWTGYDVPDIAPTAKPDVVGPFIMNPEGTARLFTRGMMRDGPFPAHYEPFESPMVNVLAPKMRGNPVARVFKDDLEQFGDAKEFPYAATSYRLTEHFHFWTKHNEVNASLQPEFFVEISASSWRRRRASRAAAGSGSGRSADRSKRRPWSPSASRRCTCDGKTVHVVGIPLHWGFTGAAKKGFGPNSLTPFVGDANIETPEYKAFLVNIEPIAGPVA